MKSTQLAHTLAHHIPRATAGEANYRSWLERLDRISQDRATPDDAKALLADPESWARYEADHPTKPIRPNLAFPQNARDLFLHAIQKLSPAVLIDLRDSAACASASEQPARIEAWASAFNLTLKSEVPGWITRQAEHTINCWKRHPALARGDAPSWVELVRYGYYQGTLMVPVSKGHPDETRREKRKRMRQEANLAIDQYLNGYKGYNGLLTRGASTEMGRRIVKQYLEGYSENRTPEHVYWLVRFQFNDESHADIARHPADEPRSVDVPAIKAAIRMMARTIGITPRLAGKPGRPRSSENL